MPSLNPSGMFLTDISDLGPVKSVPAGNIQTGVATVSTGSTMWTGQNDAIDRQGAQDDSNWSANTYKTVVNLTATKRIFFSCFVGPTLPTAGDTLQLRVTVDGAQYTTPAFASQVNGDRIVIGPTVPRDTTFTTASRLVGLMTGTSSDGITLKANEAQLVSTEFSLSAGAPIIRCMQSLLIEARISVALSSTANQERRSGAFYIRTV